MKITGKIIVALFLTVSFFDSICTPPRAFFGEKIREVLLSLIRNEKQCIKIAMYTFTDPAVAKALLKAHDRGVRVECVVDGFTNRIPSGKGYCLHTGGIMVMQYLQKDRTDLMHSKYTVFDKTKLHKGDKCSSCVMTGSCNCTLNAAFNNFENAVILSDQDIIDRYHKNFCKIKRESAKIPLDLAERRSGD